MRSNLLVVPVLVLASAACGVDFTPPLPAPQRLERVGVTGAAEFDAVGYPARIDAPTGTYLLSWEKGRLRHVIAETADRSVEATFAYDAGRLVEMTATGRHDHLAYTASGSLAAWETQGASPMRRAYSYDSLDRIVAIDDTQFTYNEFGCPHRAITNGETLEYVFADDGFLAAIADDRGVVGIEYNDDGLIRQFQASAQTLEYAEGEAVGFDMWPGHLFGGAARGFPQHGELFHLDGTCDPTLSEQGTILALVVGSLL